ncbi:MAG: hypothetical protein ACREA9_04615, partial [Pyrinomonadaceae bacterium]
MRARVFVAVLISALFLPVLSSPTSARLTFATSPQNRDAPALGHIPAPEEILGFVPGADRKLASWDQVIRYFEELDKVSERVTFETLGQSTMGKPFVMATISTPENLARLDEFKAIQG